MQACSHSRCRPLWSARAAGALAVLALLLFPAASTGAQSSPVAFDWASASSRPGAWTLGGHGGWPWSGLRGQVGLAPRLTLVGEVDTAVFRRFQPSAGVAVLLAGTSRGRLSLELGLGGVVQGGALPQQGPSATLRVRLAARPAPVGPYLAAGTRHTVLFHRTRTLRLSQEKPEVAVRAEHRWSPWVQLGLVFAPHRHVGFDVALDLHFVDVGVTALSLPGFHVGVHVGNPSSPGKGR